MRTSPRGHRAPECCIPGFAVNTALIALAKNPDDGDALLPDAASKVVEGEGLFDQSRRMRVPTELGRIVNGLPLVHVELKRRGQPLEEAFNQIERYQCDSFWSGSGLYEYVQIFVISNGTHTKYYSNTTRFSHIAEMAGRARSGKKSSNSFKFTSWWADADNLPIRDLVPFTLTFFSKHALPNILTKCRVFDVDENLLVMRPYQIVATERILNRILNKVKSYGNIVCSRNLEDDVSRAIALFGDKDVDGLLLLRPCAEYLALYTEKLNEPYEELPIGRIIEGEAPRRRSSACSAPRRRGPVLHGGFLRIRMTLPRM